MSSLYIDCRNGISGNSLVGAFLSLGLEEAALQEEIAKLLGADAFRLIIHRREFDGTSYIYFNTETLAKGRSTDRISAGKALEIVQQSRLAPKVKNRTEMILRRLFESKAKAHAVAMKDVHFIYEGMVDTLIDVIGVSLGMEVFKVHKVIANNVNTGQGIINIGDRRMSIPAPMTKILLSKHGIYHNERGGELTTPTGAAVIASFVYSTSEVVPVDFQVAGYGLPTINANEKHALKIGMHPVR